MLTADKNLRTGKTLWRSMRSPTIPTEELVSDQKADIVIIGAGITGAMAARELSAAGFSVIMLDRRGPLNGATSATTALLQYEIDQPLVKLRKQIGEANAVRAWRRSKLALDSLTAKIQSLKIECNTEDKSSLYLAGNILDSVALREEWSLRNSIGLYTDFHTRSSLLDNFGIRRNAALQSYGNLTVNPLRLAGAFLLEAVNNGSRIFSKVTAEKIDLNSNRIVRLKTEEGPTITARYLIYASGYEIPHCVPTSNTIHSTYVIATAKQPKDLWPEQCLIWEASDPYLYVRTTEDGRVICGGEDEDFENEEKRDSLLAKKTARLEKKLSQLFPNLNTKAEFAWCGSFGASKTGLPTIGEIPGMKNCFSIMSFGGNGITYSCIAAELLTSQLTGKCDPDADLFAF
ncbi:FAD-binding oxidoreductase [soil metagenome]